MSSRIPIIKGNPINMNIKYFILLHDDGIVSNNENGFVSFKCEMPALHLYIDLNLKDIGFRNITKEKCLKLTSKHELSSKSCKCMSIIYHVIGQ